MALSVSFSGTTIYKPGAYSRTTIDQGGNPALGQAGLIAIFGEADAGAPGSAELDMAQNFYTADRLSEARAKYRSGPIADALAMLFSPAADGAIPNGAQVVWIYKTNASTRSTLALPNTYGSLRAREWGVGGNQITYKATLVGDGSVSILCTPPAYGAALDAATFSISAKGGTTSVITLSGTPANHADAATTSAEILALLPVVSGITWSVSVAAPSFTIKATPSATHYQLGSGLAVELIESTPTNLAKFGLTASLKTSTSEEALSATVKQYRDNLSETDIIGGNVVLEIGRSNASGATSASVSISALKITLTDSVGVNELDKAAFNTLSQIATAISLIPGWSASVSDSLYNQLPLSSLDHVTAAGAFSASGKKPARIKKDAYEYASAFADSNVVETQNLLTVGLHSSMVETLLAGGSKGGSSSLDMVNALASFEKFHVNSVIPLFSRDATADIADSLTDATSAYTIDGIHQAVKTHISLMKSVKKRSERQGYLSLKASYANSRSKVGDLADARIQLMIQDVRQIDAAGSIKWFQPWAGSCMIAGARGGAAIGLPLTFKFMNCSGIRHTAQAMSTPESNIVIDFDPDTQYDDAIQSGLTFMEAPRTGGFRIVVDNTTYGVDDNWVFNRGNVLYAADIVAYNFRNVMEQRYVGVKNTVRAVEVKGTAESVLATFLAQGITVGTSDAPQGFKDLTVRIEGNTIYISVTIKLVEGIDFVLADITVQRASQTA